MATFKLVQRVKKVRVSVEPNCWEVVPVGAEGTVMALDDGGSYPIRIEYDAFGRAWADNYMLAPLTDPDAEKFIESIKKLAREPQNLVIKERA